MEDFGSWLSSHDLTGIAGLVFIALLVITDRLVWHTRLEKAEARADHWEQIALRGLGVAERLTVASEAIAEAATSPPGREGTG